MIFPDAIDRDPTAGAALIAGLRQIDPHLPIVVTAEKGDVNAAARAVNAGATDFLVRGENLRQRIATLLGKLRPLFGSSIETAASDADNTDCAARSRRGWRSSALRPP